jgi:ABC-type polysaccharide transport system permease subunit
MKAFNALKKDFIRNWQLYLLLLIPLAFLIVFNYVPIYGLQIAFKRFNGAKGIWGSPWAGLEHFRKFFSTYYFKRVLTNTFLIGLYSLLAGFPFSIIFALALNVTQYVRFKKAVQMITYAPYFISTVVMVGLINQLLSTHYGIFNQFRDLFGMERITFLNEVRYFIHIYVGVCQIEGCW